MMKDVQSGTKKKSEFLLGKKIKDEKNEGRDKKIIDENVERRAIGYKKENLVFTVGKKY